MPERSKNSHTPPPDPDQPSDSAGGPPDLGYGIWVWTGLHWEPYVDPVFNMEQMFFGGMASPVDPNNPMIVAGVRVGQLLAFPLHMVVSLDRGHRQSGAGGHAGVRGTTPIDCGYCMCQFTNQGWVTVQGQEFCKAGCTSGCGTYHDDGSPPGTIKQVSCHR